MAATTALAIGSLALAAVGTGVQIAAGRRQAQAQEEIVEQQEARAKVQERRQRRRVLRQRRQARAQIENVSAQTGAQGGSGELGGLTSVSSQAGFEQGVIGQTANISSNIFSAQRDIGRARELGSIGSGISSVGGFLFENRKSIVNAFQ